MDFIINPDWQSGSTLGTASCVFPRIHHIRYMKKYHKGGNVQHSCVASSSNLPSHKQSKAGGHDVINKKINTFQDSTFLNCHRWELTSVDVDTNLGFSGNYNWVKLKSSPFTWVVEASVETRRRKIPVLLELVKKLIIHHQIRVYAS